MEWDNSIKTEDHGMAGGESYYSLEDLYQAFKERLMTESTNICNSYVIRDDCPHEGKYNPNSLSCKECYKDGVENIHETIINKKF